MYKQDLLAGETILVTGGGSGLGQSMAARFGSLGASVGVLGRREAPLQETVEAINNDGGNGAWASADVRDRDSLESAIDKIEDQLGPITGLVNNAAGNFLCPSEDLSPNAFNSVVQIVLYGTFHATQAMGRRWIERKSGGTLLSIVVSYAWMGSPFVLPSACSKAGVLALTRSLAVEWAEYDIRANAIAPGPFPTEGAFSRLMVGGMEEEARKRIPLRRFGEPSELSDLAAYLMAPGSGYVNGEVVTIDGGEWLQSGQEFSAMTQYPREQLKQMLASFKPGS